MLLKHIAYVLQRNPSLYMNNGRFSLIIVFLVENLQLPFFPHVGQDLAINWQRA